MVATTTIVNRKWTNKPITEVIPRSWRLVPKQKNNKTATTTEYANVIIVVIIGIVIVILGIEPVCTWKTVLQVDGAYESNVWVCLWRPEFH